MTIRALAVLGLILRFHLTLPAAAPLPALPRFDFHDSREAALWIGPHDLERPQFTPDGLELHLAGPDPYLHGPARDYPTNTPLWLVVRLRSEPSGPAEFFYYHEQARAGESVQFFVPGGRWSEHRLALPSLGPGYHLRFDPPGSTGRVVLAEIRIEPRVQFPPPRFAEWQPPAAVPPGSPSLHSGDIALAGNPQTPLNFALSVHGRTVAISHPGPRAAYVHEAQVHWIDFATGTTKLDSSPPDSLRLTTRLTDPQGGEWVWQQSYRPGPAGVLAIESSVTITAERQVLFLPLHQWIIGEGSFGRHKRQGLFAGLEYLDDEPSRSEADIVGPEANRRVPPGHKITFPLMAIAADGVYAGLIWDEPRKFAALFDSPDRTYHSGGHLVGVLFPGATADDREEGSLLPYTARRVSAGEPIRSAAWLIGGQGADIIPAIQAYIRLRGWPPRPSPGLDFPAYVARSAKGWQTSRIREGSLYRHAYWPGFDPQPAADAAVWQLWLAQQTADPAAAGSLRESAHQALSAVPSRNLYHAGVGHVRPPLAPLVFGHVREAIDAARQIAQAQLGQFNPDHSIPYRRSKSGADYGRTHFAPDANGLTAQVVATLLEAAAFCGDTNLIAEGLTRLRALAKFRHGVPRGAQTWEVPLHTPDILASAHLVRAFTLGYQMTGDPSLLQQAVEWAWTGVPFVYLVNPTGQPVGPYSTIAVLGATSWKAPVWFGRPVQWCGLAYADALARLAPFDRSAPWQALADGIAGAGLQHSWPSENAERAGLLPDFFELAAQSPSGPAINPATVAFGAASFYGQAPLYAFQVLRHSGLTVHAAGPIEIESDTANSARFKVRAWPRHGSYLLVNGVSREATDPVIRLNQQLPSALEFDATSGTIIVGLPGTTAPSDVEIRIR